MEKIDLVRLMVRGAFKKSTDAKNVAVLIADIHEADMSDVVSIINKSMAKYEAGEDYLSTVEECAALIVNLKKRKVIKEYKRTTE